MTWIDYAIIGVIGISALAGLMRGLVREAVSLFVWFLAIWVAWQYFRTLAHYLSPWIGSTSIRFGVAALILFLAILILGGLFGMIIGMLIDQSGLSSIDQMLGMLFGALRGLVLIVILVLLGGATTLPREPWWRDSQLLTPVQQIAMRLVSLLPPDVARYFRF